MVVQGGDDFGRPVNLAVRASAGQVLVGPERGRASTRDEPVNLSGFLRRLISIVRQPVLIAATRCYLIQMHDDY